MRSFMAVAANLLVSLPFDDRLCVLAAAGLQSPVLHAFCTKSGAELLWQWMARTANLGLDNGAVPSLMMKVITAASHVKRQGATVKLRRCVSAAER